MLPYCGVSGVEQKGVPPVMMIGLQYTFGVKPSKVVWGQCFEVVFFAFLLVGSYAVWIQPGMKFDAVIMGFSNHII